MELHRIKIKNFRSIKDAEIKFDHNCLILLGKNEAGKSNVLKAIAAVFGKYPVTNKDKRKRIGNEKIEEYFVMAVFKLSSQDINDVIDRFTKLHSEASLIKFKSGKNLFDFVQTIFGDFLINISLDDNSNVVSTYWSNDKKEFELDSPLFILANKLKTINDPESAPFDLERAIFDIVKQIFSEQKFNCHYWQYSDGYLLPNSVNRAAFIANPSSIKGLENLFILCGREKIAKEFENAILQDEDYSNLLEQVSNEVTKIFFNAWEDFKDTSIQLLSDGDNILIKVVNKTKYSFEDRSDGFKKYISILLMLSTQSRSNRINEKDLILIDEPDQSLYPTSAKYLKDELLNISKKSKMVYSTHSQYMIDSDCIERHLIVEKTDDITNIKRENKLAPYIDDELLRNAIGTSIFESIKAKNIIFEGYLDKEIFNKYCAAHKKTFNFKDYGMVYLSGISGVEALIQLLILAKKEFIIIADSDETSKNKRNDFAKNYPEYKNNWLAYADVCRDVSTMEDFVKNEVIEQDLKKIAGEFIYEPNKNAIQNIEKVVSKDKEKKQEVKNRLIRNLKKEHIKDDYGFFLERLKVLLEAL
jgi:predicted ATP-dependent endonuclease of OLD family